MGDLDVTPEEVEVGPPTGPHDPAQGTEIDAEAAGVVARRVDDRDRGEMGMISVEPVVEGRLEDSDSDSCPFNDSAESLPTPRPKGLVPRASSSPVKKSNSTNDISRDSHDIADSSFDDLTLGAMIVGKVLDGVLADIFRIKVESATTAAGVNDFGGEGDDESDIEVIEVLPCAKSQGLPTCSKCGAVIKKTNLDLQGVCWKCFRLRMDKCHPVLSCKPVHNFIERETRTKCRVVVKKLDPDWEDNLTLSELRGRREKKKPGRPRKGVAESKKYEDFCVNFFSSDNDNEDDFGKRNPTAVKGKKMGANEAIGEDDFLDGGEDDDLNTDDETSVISDYVSSESDAEGVSTVDEILEKPAKKEQSHNVSKERDDIEIVNLSSDEDDDAVPRLFGDLLARPAIKTEPKEHAVINLKSALSFEGTNCDDWELEDEQNFVTSSSTAKKAQDTFPNPAFPEKCLDEALLSPSISLGLSEKSEDSTEYEIQAGVSAATGTKNPKISGALLPPGELKEPAVVIPKLVLPPKVAELVKPSPTPATSHQGHAIKVLKADQFSTVIASKQQSRPPVTKIKGVIKCELCHRPVPEDQFPRHLTEKFQEEILSQHSIRLTNEKRWSCRVCPRADVSGAIFHTPVSMANHLQREHNLARAMYEDKLRERNGSCSPAKNDVAEKLDPSMPEKVPLFLPADKKCQLCGIVVDDCFHQHLFQNHFKDEIMRQVGESSPFKCKQCTPPSHSYNNRIDLVNHIKTDLKLPLLLYHR